MDSLQSIIHLIHGIHITFMNLLIVGIIKKKDITEFLSKLLIS